MEGYFMNEKTYAKFTPSVVSITDYIKEGTLVRATCNVSLIGRVELITAEGYIKLVEVCVELLTPQGPAMEKLLSDTVFVKPFVVEVMTENSKSRAYSAYIELTTGIKIPSKLVH